MNHAQRQIILASLDQYESELELTRLAMIEPAPRVNINPFSGRPYPSPKEPCDYDPQRERFLQVRS
jgi:hypothetical protein